MVPAALEVLCSRLLQKIRNNVSQCQTAVAGVNGDCRLKTIAAADFLLVTNICTSNEQ